MATEPLANKKYQQELTCYGYVRQVQRELIDQIIPDIIAAICFQYYLYVELLMDLSLDLP